MLDVLVHQHQIESTSARKIVHQANGNYNDVNQFIFDNLDSESVYDFTICAIGSNNVKSEWSPVVSVWVM